MHPSTSIEITAHPHSPTHQLAKVIVRGRVYAVTFAEPFPTAADVRQLWRTDRRAFRPYDESSGHYLR